MTGVADGDVGSGVCLGLRFAAAESNDCCECDQLTLFNVQNFSGVVITEAVGAEVVINVFLVSGSTGIHFVDVFSAEDGTLYGKACVMACFIGSCSGRSAGLDFEHFHNLVNAFQCCLYLWQTNVGGAVENAFVNLLGRCACFERAFNVCRNIFRRVVRC